MRLACRRRILALMPVPKTEGVVLVSRAEDGDEGTFQQESESKYWVGKKKNGVALLIIL